MHSKQQVKAKGYVYVFEQLLGLWLDLLLVEQLLDLLLGRLAIASFYKYGLVAYHDGSWPQNYFTENWQPSNSKTKAWKTLSYQKVKVCLYACYIKTVVNCTTNKLTTFGCDSRQPSHFKLKWIELKCFTEMQDFAVGCSAVQMHIVLRTV